MRHRLGTFGTGLLLSSHMAWGCFAGLSLEEGLRKADRVVIGRVASIQPNAIPYPEEKQRQSADDFQGSISLRDIASRAWLAVIAGRSPASGASTFELGFPGTSTYQCSTDQYHHEGQTGLWLLRWILKGGVWSAAYHPQAFYDLSGAGQSGRSALTRMGWWHRSIECSGNLFQNLGTLPLPPQPPQPATARSAHEGLPPRGTAWLIRHPLEAFQHLPISVLPRVVGVDFSREAVLVVKVRGELPLLFEGHSRITLDHWRDPEHASEFQMLSVRITLQRGVPHEPAPTAIQYAMMRIPAREVSTSLAIFLNVYFEHPKTSVVLATGLAPAAPTRP